MIIRLKLNRMDYGNVIKSLIAALTSLGSIYTGSNINRIADNLNFTFHSYISFVGVKLPVDILLQRAAWTIGIMAGIASIVAAVYTVMEKISIRRSNKNN